MELHLWDEWSRDVVETAKRDVDDAVPVFGWHKSHQVVAANACIVDNHLDVFILVGILPGFESRLDLFGVTYIELQHLAIATSLTHQAKCLFGSIGAAHIINNNMVAQLCQLDTHCTANAAATSCD